MTLRTLDVPNALQLAGGVRYVNGARSIFLNAVIAQAQAPLPRGGCGCGCGGERYAQEGTLVVNS